MKKISFTAARALKPLLFFLFFPALLFGKTKYVTLDSVGDVFVVHGVIKKINPYPSLSEAPVELKRTIPNFTVVRFTETGYFSIEAVDDDGETLYSVFVSPVPSVHAGKTIEEMDWYLTQFNTGTLSNCGPASSAMAISWGSGNLFPVSAVREAVGWQGDGGTSFEELLPVIKKNGVDAELRPLRNFDDIKELIDGGCTAIVLFNISGLTTSAKEPLRDPFGKYYEDDVGHYIVVKGYSKDGKYIIVHDPIPSDWSRNRLRYADGVSMIGKNRYYPASELLGSLRRRDMIAVKGVRDKR